MFALCCAACAPALAADGDETLLVYAINVHRTPKQTWGPGYGIYLGRGLFVTAAHVAGHTWLTRPKVVIGGEEFPTSVVKAGDFETIDLTLLRVEEAVLPFRLRLRLNPLCRQPPWPGEPVVTVVPEGTVRSYVLSPKVLPANARKFDTVIRDVPQSGNSGSGVFDANHKCLLGIISRKISVKSQQNGEAATEPSDLAKFFVPVSDLVKFMPPDLR